MRKLVIFLASAALMAFTASCGVFRTYSARMADIHPGMTRSYVLIEIVFVDGKVYSMDSHRVDTPYGPPGVPHPGHDRPEPPHPGTGVHVELHADSE